MRITTSVNKQNNEKSAAVKSHTVCATNGVHRLLQLQRDHGNQFMQRALNAALTNSSCACNGTCKPSQSTKSPETISTPQSPGRPLDETTRHSMENAFGTDLSGVRVHTGDSAARSAEALGATAYTAGKNIVFGQGHYNPATVAGKELLAHELAHVVQQRNTNRQNVSYEMAEREARQASKKALTGVPIEITGNWAGGPQLQPHSRQEIVNRLRVLEDQASNSSMSQRALLESNLEQARLMKELKTIDNQFQEAKPKRTATVAPIGDPVDQQLTIPVRFTAEIVGVLPGGGGLSSRSTSGEEQSNPIVDFSSSAGKGTLGSAGTSFGRFVSPLPGNVPSGTPNVYTRFAGPGAGESFFNRQRFNLNRDLTPRFLQSPLTAVEEAERLEASLHYQKRLGVSMSELAEISRKLRTQGFGGLNAAEQQLLRSVTAAHAQLTGPGGTSMSPLMSATELAPEELLALADAKQITLPVATKRAYIVRVQLDPNDVGKVNEILARTSKSSGQMVNELEVIIAKDLTGTGKGQPKILSITPNPKGALGGAVGTGLKIFGHALAVLGAGLTAYEILNAKGANRRETEGRAFGAFAGGTLLGGLATGVCIGAGIATGGAALLLCGLGAALIGGVGGGFLGGAIGRQFD